MSHPTETCERHLEAGRRALSLGDLATAESELRAAIASAEAGAGKPDALGGALGSLAQLLYQARRFAEAAPVFARTLELREMSAGPEDPGLVAPLHNLAAVHVAAGNIAAAQPLLHRALGILEHVHGPEHPELSGVLNALSQLCLKRGAYAEAEPLLKRLLTIRRSEGGEERPEVATIMASLASVHHALAEHDAAERLLRRVLEIRERTLAPNHFAIATSLEALAETCATRGKLAEALALLQRALDMRERTLEPAHASLAVVRAKIADLQLQLSSDAFAVPLMEPAVENRAPAVPTPSSPLPLPGAGFVRTSPITPGARPVAAPAPAPLTEFRAPERVSLESSSIDRIDRDAMRQLAAEMEESAPTLQTAERALASGLSVAYLPTGSALVLPGERVAQTGGVEGSLQDDELDFELGRGDERRAPSLLGGSSTRIAVLGVTVLALAATAAMVARANRPDAGDGFVQSSTTASATPARSSAAGTIALPDAGTAAAPVALDSAPSQRQVASPPAPRSDDAAATRTAARAADARATRPTEVAPQVPSTPAPLGARVLQGVNVRIDASAPAFDIRAGDAQREAGAAIGALRPGRQEPNYATMASFKPAAPIGALPQPRYPPELRRAKVGGDVTVSFLVGTDGLVEASSFRIVSASDVRFVGAVTDVLSRLRFMPAESAGVRVPQRVEMPFRFNP